MRMKSLHLLGLMAMAVTALYGQDPVYYSNPKPDCSSLADPTPVKITNSSGATLGYSCHVAGTFVWLAAGGDWGTTIRVSAPASGDIDVDYSFYDGNGHSQFLDNAINNDPSSIATTDGVNLSLYANQPLEIELPSDQPTATGSVYAQFYCPDAATCNDVLPQLIYSALPNYPWSLSVPIAWDSLTWTQWSAVGIDDGVDNVMSFVVYNADTVAKNFTVSVYDGDGFFVDSGTIFVPPSPGTGQGGTRAALLSDVVGTLPNGICKVLIDGGSVYSAVEVLQINGSSATTLQVAYDTSPAASAAATKGIHRPAIRRARMVTSPTRVIRPKRR